ncbi:MAG: site-specific DNA-methyltransferase [Bacillota bacterium]|nr:site-specific DNA-methyltransferase [Bacillota bacterium]
MRLIPTECYKEVHGKNLRGEFYSQSAQEALPALLEKYAEKVSLIYLDPPFMTGQKFQMKQRYGEAGYRGDTRSMLELPAFEDHSARNRSSYLAEMKEILLGCRELLSDEGSVYMHVDQRLSAHMRLLLDEVFGEKQFSNEIVWHYKSGGRSADSFSHKHDNIFVYSKGAKPYFDISAVSERRGAGKRNHMKKMVGEDGRVYFTIRSGGKLYSYSEDDLLFPGDVWDDLPHLQQKAPERTGYDTQKPEKLLERIIVASCPEGGCAADLFAGSGTTLAVAAGLKRRFIGVDNSPASLHVVRKRLLDTGCGFELIGREDAAYVPGLKVRLASSDGGHSIQLISYSAQAEKRERDQSYRQMNIEESTIGGEEAAFGFAGEGFEALDYWAAGHIREGVFAAAAGAYRSTKGPALHTLLYLPRSEGELCIHTVDAYGGSAFFTLQS